MFAQMNRRSKWRRIFFAVTILGVVLVTGDLWSQKVFFPMIFDSSGNYRSGGIFFVVTPVLNFFDDLFGFGWFYGLPVLFGGLVGLAFTFPIDSARWQFFNSRPFSTASLVVTVSAHVLVFLFSIQFFFIPAGSEIRPMGWAGFMFLIAAFAFVIGLPLGIIAATREKPKFLGIIGIVMSFTASFFSTFLLHFAEHLKGFVLEP
jgi:hypothetical protein